MNSRTRSKVSPRLKRMGVLALGLTPFAYGAAAQAATITLPPVSLGAEMRSSFRSTDVDGVDEDVNDFNLDSARININGSITDTIKFTLNTDYQGDSENDVQIIDAIGRFELSPTMNIWAGRFLPPSDRANLYGPYFANNFGVYVDGVQDGYPFVAAGRDNGVAYWGDFDRLKVSLGLFDAGGPPGTPGTTRGDQDTVVAGRVHYSFWDIETGYYLNGTYYGEKDILSVGIASHIETGGDKAYTVDFLMEKKVAGGGAVTVEAEYAKYDEFGGYNTGGLPFSESDGFFVLGAYLFPQTVGIGKFQVLGKYAETDYEDGVIDDGEGGVVLAPDFSQETMEFNLNYIIKAFNTRLSLFYIGTDFDDDAPDIQQIGLGIQVRI